MGRVKPLSDAQIKGMKPKDKEYKVADGDGLYLHITPNNSKIWRLRYTIDGKLSTLSIGKYPIVSLKEAREERDKCKKNIGDGKSPRKAAKLTFRDIAEKYFTHRDDLDAGTMKAQKSLLERDVHKFIGSKALDDVTIDDMIQIIERMEARGLKEATRKGASLVNRIYRYANTKRYTDANPIASIDLSILLKKRDYENRAHTTDPMVLKSILAAIDGYIGDYSTKVAMMLMPYVFVRPANLAAMEWSEINFETKRWEIPASKMKMDKDHIVPLTDTMIKIIKLMEGNNSKYVFHSPRTKARPISRDTLNAGLHRLGLGGITTAHGFRHTASTILHENIHIHKVHGDAIERQMAHTDSNQVRGVYNKALYIEERERLMQWWSDFLDGLKVD